MMSGSGANASIIVVGAGAFGAWTALSLRERGAQVLLIDTYGPGNHLGSSGGESRNIRAAYGDRDIYTRWSIRAWSLWQEREVELGLRCLYPSGSLRVLPQAEMVKQSTVFDRFAHPHEVLSCDEVRRRWPQIHYREPDPILFEPKSGTIAARDALVAVVDRFRSLGGRYRQGHVAVPRVDKARLGSVVVDEDIIAADRFVFACGPWLPQVFPDLIGNHIKTPRRELFFLAPAPGDRRFDWQHCPSLTDPGGWTSSDIGGGVKFAPVIRHVPMDPDNGSRMPTPALLDQVRAFAASRLPDLAARPVVSTYVSQLENTDNEHFIIDNHPALANVVIAGGGSGHAFKMGPVIGEHVAALTIDGVQDAESAALFGLASHGPVAAGQGG